MMAAPPMSESDVAVEAIPMMMAKSTSARNNNYDLATTVFNAESSLGQYCNRCKSLKFFAFRVGNRYLTAFANDLRLVTISEPGDAQLF